MKEAAGLGVVLKLLRVGGALHLFWTYFYIQWECFHSWVVYRSEHCLSSLPAGLKPPGSDQINTPPHSYSSALLVCLPMVGKHESNRESDEFSFKYWS